MSEKIKRNIPKDTVLYLNEITKRLWSGHAAVMVGSGFSKNAKKSNPLGKGFPNWSELGNAFYKKIHNSEPNENQHYLNVLKLADEVQAAFGRPVLDQVLRSEIPDLGYEPSQLHTNLMELPWTDVFTTNYDTLLERACVNVYSQRFDIVSCKEDLIHSEKPRIIKLHGSFPSKRPFIISEEDYRKYPKDFAPFVNTVQQSLLENNLCLIGFSGDDPNFLQWIGWIQDNLGKDNSPKIYLIGNLSLSHAQKRLLEQRNIVLVDLSDSDGVNDSHEKGLEFFINYLSKGKKTRNNLNWPENECYFTILENKNRDIQIKNAIKSWKSIRKKYPGWVILPEDRRNVLWQDIDYNMHLIYNIKNACIPYDIDLLYEFNWRIEKCLYPIPNNLISIYEKVLERYNPFNNILSIDNSIDQQDIKYKHLPWNKISQKWIELNISVMRFYREEGFIEKWELINERLQKVYQFLSFEQVASFHYERCLFALFLLDISKVREELKEWPTNNSLSLWESKRAGLMAEIGDINSAVSILEQSLNNIRKQLNLSPISNNYLLVSQEAYVMQLLQYVKSARDISSPKPDDNKENFSERWNELKHYKCDPWNEQKIFDIKLEQLYDIKPNSIEKNEFDIGRTTVSYKFGGISKEILSAYSFLRYYEEIGMPFKIQNYLIGQKAAKGALRIISSYSSYWAFATLVRMANQKVVDVVFNCKFICEMDIAQIDVLINKYLLVLDNVMPVIMVDDRSQDSNFSIRLATIIPEILSRLCVRCSNDVKVKVLDFLQKVYSCSYKQRFQGISNLIKRFINSLSDREQYELLNSFLDFEILSEAHEIEKRNFPDPFHFISINKDIINEYEQISIKDSVIEDLIKKSLSTTMTEARKRAILRLEKLYILNLLSDDQIKIFGQALWNEIDEDTGFPKDTYFYNFVFLTLPHPNTINPLTIFKEFIFNNSIPIQSLKEDKSVSMTGGNITILNEIINGTKNRLIKNNKGVCWSEEETLDIFERLIEWWDADKHYLKEDNIDGPFGSTQDEFYSRFKNLIYIISIILPPITSLKNNKDVMGKLLKLFKEFDEYDLPYLQVKAACLFVLDLSLSSIYFDILNAIGSKKKNRIIDALYAILEIINLYDETDEPDKDLNKILDILSEQIKWRREDSLISSLNVVTTIVIMFPGYLNEKFLQDILMGLKYLCDESDPKNESINNDIADRLAYRKSAANLAFELYLYYSKRKEKIPPTIIKWKDICLDENEFFEIRNQWKI